MAPVVTAPPGVEPVPGGLGSGFADALDGFSYGIGGSLYYDTNIFQSNGGFGRPIEGDMVYSISPYVAYRNPGSDFSFGGRFALDYLGYFDNSGLGGLGYSTGINVGYQGGKIRFNGDFTSSLSNGSNRNYNNANVEALNFGTRLNLGYILSPKTTIDSRLGYSWSEPSGAVFSTTDSFNFDVSALWRYSALTRIGPGVSLTQQGGSNRPDRQTIGPIIRINYQLAQKVALDGTFGLDFVDSGGGTSDTSFSTRLGVNYQASSVWGMNLSIYKGVQANGGVGSNFRDIFSVRAGYTHKIRRARLGLGVAYEMNSPDGAGAAIDPDRDYFNFDASIGMPVFYNRANASIFYSWNQQTGGQAFDGQRFGLSLSTAF